MQWSVGLLFFSVLLFSKISVSASLAFSRNARTFELQHTSLITKGLAQSCLSLISISDSLPCNPAMTPYKQKPSLGLELMLSNGYPNLKNVQRLLDNDYSQEDIDTIFNEGKVIQIEANADIRFESKYISGLYTPFSVKGFSAVRNEANPDVEIYAIEEKGFTFQTGFAILPDLNAGLQLRTLSRKFIKQRFKLVSLATPEGQNLLKPKDQNVTYFEPAMTYFFQNSWKPRASIMVVNSGFVSEKFEELQEPIEAQFGFAISPPVSWGTLDINLDYRSMTYEENDLKKLRLGALYHFGAMDLMTGIDNNGLSGGVYLEINKFNAGILFSTTQFINEGESFYTQTVYVQLGWQI